MRENALLIQMEASSNSFVNKDFMTRRGRWLRENWLRMRTMSGSKVI